MRLPLFAFIAFLTLLSWPAAGQTVTGTILGVVTDPSGAIVPGATVTAASQSTGFTRADTSDAEGNYRRELDLEAKVWMLGEPDWYKVAE